MQMDRVMMLVVQRIMGTPWFVGVWIAVVGAWFVTGGMGYDPEPYFLLNIFMSVWATLTLPILTMSDRWISEQQDRQIKHQMMQLEQMRELAEGQRDIIVALAAQIRDIDEDVDAIRDAWQVEAGE